MATVANWRVMRVLVLLATAVFTVPFAHAEDTRVTLSRSRLALQTSEAAPAAPGNATAFSFAARMVGLEFLEPVQNARVTPPGGAATALTKVAEGTYVLEKGFTTESALRAAYPDGRYTFNATVNLLGATGGHAELPPADFPTYPQIHNFVAAQDIDVSQEYTLSWKAFDGANENDEIAFTLTRTDTGEVVAEEVGLDPTTSEWVFSADTLPGEVTLKGRLAFRRLASDSDPEGGELIAGRAFLVSQTEFTLVTHGASTPVDTTPPSLTSSTPTNGGKLGTQLDALLFQFSEPMNTSGTAVVVHASIHEQEVALDASKFLQHWNDEGTMLLVTYTALTGWPAGSTLTWLLNPPGADHPLVDIAGNPLPFLTGVAGVPGGVDPCDSLSNGVAPGSSFAFFKQVHYVQASAENPVPDTTLGAEAFGFISLPADTPVQTIVTLKVPTSNPFAFQLKVLSPPQGSPSLRFRTFTETFAARSDLDAAYPAGNYSFELRNSQALKTNAVSLVVSATGYPPIPHVSNFAACQAVDPSAAFTVQWDAFTGAKTNSEFVGLQIYDNEDVLVFHAPDPCNGLVLDPASNSILIPAGTLAKGKTYTASLTFTRMTDSGKVLTGVPGTGISAMARITQFPIATGIQPPPSAPVIQQVHLVGESHVELRIACTVGRELRLEKASQAQGPFSVLMTTNVTVSPLILPLTVPEPTVFLRAVHP